MGGSDDLAQLAMAQAMYHELGRMVKTGDPSNLRGRCDALLADGTVDRVRMNVNGKAVGTISARWSKARTDLVVEDADAFAGWLAGDGLGYLREWVARGCRGSIMELCASALVTDGEIPAGCRAEEVPEQMVGTVLKGCRLDEVAEAFGRNLPEAVVFALTGGAS